MFASSVVAFGVMLRDLPSLSIMVDSKGLCHKERIMKPLPTL